MIRTREVVGRRIVAVRSNRWWDSGRRFWAHRPVIVLDDGSELFFSVEETDSGEYGISVGRRKRAEKTR